MVPVDALAAGPAGAVDALGVVGFDVRAGRVVVVPGPGAVVAGARVSGVDCGVAGAVVVRAAADVGAGAGPDAKGTASTGGGAAPDGAGATGVPSIIMGSGVPARSTGRLGSLSCPCQNEP
ncbi:hypothetical protein [Mangrovihabitans endophyticus]|uniref:Uncharacterized protein n=1 Tax=Mangrovihabitans endophyticus TaxID=1751298 RepID=A0A8J3C3I0_9ACTN|nr:hypothetical protein [Mangrovihabitans endophyticus]GGL04740.1 hypothetical protein GCM10012284_44130 [Mangrovihabitans endophyticus]